jgi:hypothetical protein
MRGGLRHCAVRDTTAEAAPLAGERNRLVVSAVTAAQPQEAARPDAALQKSGELVLDELRQVHHGGGFDLGEEACGMLLYQAVQPSLFGAARS